MLASAVSQHCRDIPLLVVAGFQADRGRITLTDNRANDLCEDSCYQGQKSCAGKSTAGRSKPSEAVGRHGTLIGIYDGHGGPEVSRFITNHLFPKIEGFTEEAGGMSAKVLKQAFSATEEEFLGLADKNWHSKPRIASVGSCCLVGVVSENTLYTANLGDSRVVLGTVRQGKVEPVRLSTKKHNAGNVEVREELKAQHPDHDSHIVVLKQGVWRVKGIIQVSRSIGDVCLKKPEYNKDPRIARGGLSVSFKKPVLSAEPSLQERKLYPEDRFLIFASDGLWEHVSDQKAVDIVQKSPSNGSSRRLNLV
ncbi:hypothetical protein L7F22_067507 [Adiantum nelumboides]|nr:hypothetical protein [Adiantum nelumboides]